MATRGGVNSGRGLEGRDYLIDLLRFPCVLIICTFSSTDSGTHPTQTCDMRLRPRLHGAFYFMYRFKVIAFHPVHTDPFMFVQGSSFH